MTEFIDLTGQKFGRLTVKYRLPNQGLSTMWLCRCDCGIEKAVHRSLLRDGRAKSCGCLSAELAAVRLLKHGCKNTREYKRWCLAKARCYNTKAKRYADWGGRGITMCDRWRNNFEAFLDDMGLCPDGYVLDRIDNDGNYEPNNCRWVTQSESSYNRRERS